MWTGVEVGPGTTTPTKLILLADAILTFLRHDVPRNRRVHCDAVSDNFRVISPRDCRVLM